MSHRIAVAAIWALGACGVPMSSTAPFSTVPTTKGAVGFAGSLEMAPIDALATVSTPPDASDPSRYPTTDRPAFRVQLDRAVSDKTRLELGADGTVYAVFPVPHSAYLGLRHLAWQHGSIDVGVATRAGYAGFLSEGDAERSIDGSQVRVGFAALTTDISFRRGKALSPGASLSVQPMWIRARVPGHEIDDTLGVSSSLTVRVAYRGIAPFASGTLHATGNVRGMSPALTFGVAFQR